MLDYETIWLPALARKKIILGYLLTDLIKNCLINILKNKNLRYARYKKPLKTTFYKWENVETYSSSNAVAQDPEERVKLNKLKIIQIIAYPHHETTKRKVRKT